MNQPETPPTIDGRSALWIVVGILVVMLLSVVLALVVVSMASDAVKDSFDGATLELHEAPPEPLDADADPSQL